RPHRLGDAHDGDAGDADAARDARRRRRGAAVNGRNPDLPILDELGTEFEALARSAYAAEGSGATAPTREVERRTGAPDRRAATANGGPDGHTVRRRALATPPRRGRERGAQARRIGRRAAIVLVLICLVGGVAFAALRGGGSEDHAHTTPALL